MSEDGEDDGGNEEEDEELASLQTLLQSVLCSGVVEERAMYEGRLSWMSFEGGEIVVREVRFRSFSQVGDMFARGVLSVG